MLLTAPAKRATPAKSAAKPSALTFAEVDRVMSDRSRRYTNLQREQYWRQVRGHTVTWSGKVVDVTGEDGGTLRLKCNRFTLTFDTTVVMDGPQHTGLSTLHRGDLATFRGKLNEHDRFGYHLVNGQLIKH